MNVSSLVLSKSVSQTFYPILYASLAFVIVICNLLVLVPILVNKSLRKENRYFYMLSTSSSDLCTGFSCLYFGVMDDTTDFFSSGDNTRFIAPTFLGISYMAILAAQADRYHAVSSPYKYHQRMTLRRTILLILGMWVYAFLIVAINNLVDSVLAKKVTSTGTFLCYFCTMGIMIGLNIKLIMIAKYQLGREPPAIEREAKKSAMYLIIVVSGFFLATWLPNILRVSLCDFILLPCHTIHKETYAILKFLPRMNAAFTPALYIFCCKPLRIQVIRICRHICSCRR
ncbi:adrenocorticotropic hormone receptor-like [Pelodytes ibericus]